MISGKVYEGTVYSTDPVTNTIVLKDAEGVGYTMLFNSKIANIEGQIFGPISGDLPNISSL